MLVFSAKQLQLMNKHFGFLLFNEFEDLDFIGPWEMIGHWSKSYHGPKLSVISEKGGDVITTKGLTIANTIPLADIDKLDYLLVPGGQGTRREVNNELLVNFVKTQANYCEY